MSIKTLSQTAKDRRVGSLGFAEAILIYYNKRSKVHLTWDKLYTKKASKKIKTDDFINYTTAEDENSDVVTTANISSDYE